MSCSFNPSGRGLGLESAKRSSSGGMLQSLMVVRFLYCTVSHACAICPPSRIEVLTRQLTRVCR